MSVNHSRFEAGAGALPGPCLIGVAAGLFGCFWPGQLAANPAGMTVTKGQATAVNVGPQLNVTATHNAVLDWRSFNIGAGETTSFLQPSAYSVVWNRINDQNPSQILGNLNANGMVVLYNQNGFYFGANSVVNANGLIATTRPVMPPDSGGGGLWQFGGSPPAASIINYGQIQTPVGGSVFLIAEQVVNHGTITAPEGNIGLHAGKEVQLSERPDGRGLSVKVRLPEGSVDNRGKLVADAGHILMEAQAVNQAGLVQANSVRERNGVIELVASESIKLGPEAVLSAHGGDEGASGGGRITLKSEHTYADTATSRIDARGGALGGNGGAVEISAPSMGAVRSQLDGHAQAGWLGGELTFDPLDVILSNGGEGAAPGGNVDVGSSPDRLELNVNSAFTGFSRITIQASRDILLADATIWNLEGSTGISDPGSLLTMQAGRDILFGNNARLVGGQGWSVELAAGADFVTSHSVKPGVGGIYLNGRSGGVGNGSLETSDGDIRLFAGNEVEVGSGFIRTVAGGNLGITAVAGGVNAGTKADWYQFTRNGPVLSQNGLGGLATANGGNLSVEAGGDIVSFVPVSGAFGAGDVSLKAGGRILGKYLVRNGAGRMEAGTDIGDAPSPVTLALVAGGWDVFAKRNLYLNEVFNPNGALNANRLTTGERVKFQFDYAPDASVKLGAGNSVLLLGSSLARTAENRDLLPIYPPRLEINAGAGGIVLGNELILFPSAQGSLAMTTTDGGSLRSATPGFYQIVMSDSGDPNYKTFATGHAAKPLHLDDPEPVKLAISGNIENLFLRLPKKADIEVGGNTLNFGFEGQNLSAADRTRIAIQGDFTSRNNRTVVTLNEAPDELALDPTLSANPGLIAKLHYDPATRQLTFIGKMTAAEREFLLHPRVQLLDNNLIRQFDELGNPIYVPAVFTRDEAAIRDLFSATQDIPEAGLAYNGMQIGGPGSLVVSARNLELGITRGIRSVGPLLNNSLAAISAAGADLDIRLRGDLNITASQIASFNAGSIKVDAAGTLNIGSQEQFNSDDTPKGIFTTSGGNVTVLADQNINVNGSRIATYNGGNVTVQSRNGDVNAGEGGLGSVSIFRTEVDPVTGAVTVNSTTIPGSGILATALPGSPAQVGNIEVSAGRDILASKGGVIQLAFNDRGTAHSSVKLTAGRNIDASNSGVIGGNVSLAAEGDIKGLIIASENININAQQNVSVTAVAQGGVNISASGNVSGAVIGGSGVSVSGGSISAALVSQNVSTSGDASAASIGTPQVAAAKSDSKLADSGEKAATESKPRALEEDKDAKKRKPALTRRTGRVTVILPNP